MTRDELFEAQRVQDELRRTLVDRDRKARERDRDNPIDYEKLLRLEDQSERLRKEAQDALKNANESRAEAKRLESTFDGRDADDETDADIRRRHRCVAELNRSLDERRRYEERTRQWQACQTLVNALKTYARIEE